MMISSTEIAGIRCRRCALEGAGWWTASWFALSSGAALDSVSSTDFGDAGSFTSSSCEWIGGRLRMVSSVESPEKFSGISGGAGTGGAKRSSACQKVQKASTASLCARSITDSFIAASALVSTIPSVRRIGRDPSSIRTMPCPPTKAGSAGITRKITTKSPAVVPVTSRRRTSSSASEGPAVARINSGDRPGSMINAGARMTL